MSTVGEGEGGTNDEGSMKTYILPYVKQIAGGNLLYDSGNLNWGFSTIQRDEMYWEVGERFKKEGARLYLRLMHVDVWQKPTQYCKTVTLQLKVNKRKKKLALIF